MSGYLRVFVPGEPVPQGSMRHVGGGRVIHSNARRLVPWRNAIADAVKEQGLPWPAPLDEGVSVILRFRLQRPKSVSLRKRRFPIVYPDIDKLARAVLDALTFAGVWTDDARVVILSTEKLYNDAGPEGVDIGVMPVADTIPSK